MAPRSAHGTSYGLLLIWSEDCLEESVFLIVNQRLFDRDYVSTDCELETV
jgi:hypothetical protein